MSRVAIIAAMPGELKPLVQGWKLLPLPGARKGQAAWTNRVDDVDCIAVCGGVGSEAAAQACAISAQGGALDAIVSVGWAGATSCGIHPGNAYAVNQVIDALTGEYFATNFPLPEGSGVPLRLVTTDHIVQYAEKRQLAGHHQAVMVDMEAADRGPLRLSKNIPFYCFKAISDEIADISAGLQALHRLRWPPAHGTFAGPCGHPAKVLARHAAHGPEREEWRPSGSRCASPTHRERVICRSHLVVQEMQRLLTVPATMRAAVYHGVNDVRVETVSVPEIGPGEVLIRVHSSGICGTDLKKIHSGSHSAPRIFGHETAGTDCRNR